MVALPYERDFDMIFSASRRLKTWLYIEHYERYFDMIFHFKAAQNLVVEHYERYFNMIFHFNVAQNW